MNVNSANFIVVMMMFLHSCTETSGDQERLLKSVEYSNQIIEADCEKIYRVVDRIADSDPREETQSIYHCMVFLDSFIEKRIITISEAEDGINKSDLNSVEREIISKASCLTFPEVIKYESVDSINIKSKIPLELAINHILILKLQLFKNLEFGPMCNEGYRPPPEIYKIQDNLFFVNTQIYPYDLNIEIAEISQSGVKIPDSLYTIIKGDSPIGITIHCNKSVFIRPGNLEIKFAFNPQFDMKIGSIHYFKILVHVPDKINSQNF